MDTACFVIERCRAIPYRMEKICTCPVKYRNEVITDNFNAEQGKIFDFLDIVCDVFTTGRKSDFDIVRLYQ